MRVLLARTGALGDLLLLRTALWRLRAAGHAVTLLAPARTAALLIGPHAAQADLLLDADSALAAPVFAGDAPAEWRPALAACGAAVVYSRSAGLALGLAGLIPDVRRHDPQPVGRHAADWLCEPLQDLAPAPELPLPDLPAGSMTVAGLPAGDFVAIHPGSGSAAKNWPASHFAELASALRPRLACVWVRGPAEASLHAPAHAIELRGVPLGALAGALARARLYVGNDSGVTHLAAALGTPTLALFGPTDPGLWAPRGRRVRVLQADGARLDRLQPRTVLEAARGVSGLS